MRGGSSSSTTAPGPPAGPAPTSAAPPAASQPTRPANLPAYVTVGVPAARVGLAAAAINGGQEATVKLNSWHETPAAGNAQVSDGVACDTLSVNMTITAVIVPPRGSAVPDMANPEWVTPAVLGNTGLGVNNVVDDSGTAGNPLTNADLSLNPPRKFG